MDEPKLEAVFVFKIKDVHGIEDMISYEPDTKILRFTRGGTVRKQKIDDIYMTGNNLCIVEEGETDEYIKRIDPEWEDKVREKVDWIRRDLKN